MIKKCQSCGNDFKVKPSHFEKRKTCSKKCDGERKKEMYAGENNPNFRGENHRRNNRISVYGYSLIYKPEHPNSFSDGYMFEHRYIMSEYLGRPLKDEEHIHHKDGNKLNNDISNLEIISLEEHSKMHNHLGKYMKSDEGRKVNSLNNRGEKNNTSILKEHQVIEIIESLKEKGNEYGFPSKLAREYGVKPHVIFQIKNGKTWKHLQKQ